MRRDFVPTRNRVAGKLRRALDRAPARADRHFDAMRVEQVHDAPPRRPRAILEMAFDAGVRTVEPVHGLVDAFIDGIAIRDREFPALLEIDHKRDRNARAPGQRGSGGLRGSPQDHDARMAVSVRKS